MQSTATRPFVEVATESQMAESPDQAALMLPTTIPHVYVRELGPANVDQWVDLVNCNRDHLTQHNDNGFPSNTVEDFTRWISNTPELDLHFAICRGDELMGYVTVSHMQYVRGDDLPESPNGFGLGYWIGSDYTGNGYVTEACRAVLDYARSTLGAKEFWSGTRPGNRPSMAVLERLGFYVYEERPGGLRYRLDA